MPETLSYAADGITMRSELYAGAGAQSSGGKRPGVLVFPEFFGLGAHAKKRAERLAGMGYVALACDFYGDGWLAPDMEQAGRAMSGLGQDAGKIRARATAALEAVVARPEVDAGRVAAIGYCFGGTMALELARSGAALRAAVGFHSGLKARGAVADAKSITGRVLACIGADDPMVPPEEREAFQQEMREAGVDWQLHLYGNTVHSFTNEGATDPGMRDRIQYNAAADARSWAAMHELFGEVMKG